MKQLTKKTLAALVGTVLMASVAMADDMQGMGGMSGMSGMGGMSGMSGMGGMSGQWTPPAQ